MLGFVIKINFNINIKNDICVFSTTKDKVVVKIIEKDMRKVLEAWKVRCRLVHQKQGKHIEQIRNIYEEETIMQYL